ncbi:hypothetical protein TrVE_jg6950 [Triparma verrucosa]|uniref:Uncharacterized protein n=1 Tax=Triparma verrucosa TaxID=1606542 RepID=A0A9W7ESN9_9STRA|nr:hypothetical protein TrVE_jg6950 [Triparma verrucosa]
MVERGGYMGHNFSNSLKSLFQSILAVYIFESGEFNVGQVLGLLGCLGGSLTYTAVKIEEGRRREEREKMNDNIV